MTAVLRIQSGFGVFLFSPIVLEMVSPDALPQGWLGPRIDVNPA